MNHPKTNNTLRVALVIDDFEYGGAQRQVVELANSLNSDGVDVHVCSLSDYVPLAETLADRSRRLHVIRKRSRWDPTVVTRLARMLSRLQADVVHGFLFSADMAARLAGRLAGTPVVVSSERSTHSYLGRRNRWISRATRGCVDVVIANSRAGAAFHRRLHGHQPGQYRVVHNGVNTERFAPQDGRPIRRQLGIADDEHVVGVFASFKKEKNHALFFDASQRVLRRVPRTRLLLVGDELSGQAHGSDIYKQQIHHMVERTGIGPRCLFLGNRDDVADLYCACDVTVLPSLAEGTSNVLLESMACGVPVIATDVSDNRYIVPDGQVGCLVPLGDAATMADRICSLLEDDELRSVLGRRARQWVSREFSIAQLAAKTRNVYLECLAHKCPTRLPDGIRLAQ